MSNQDSNPTENNVLSDNDKRIIRWMQYVNAVVDWKNKDLKTLLTDLSATEVSILAAFLCGTTTSQLSDPQLAEFIQLVNYFRNLGEKSKEAVVATGRATPEDFAVIVPRTTPDDVVPEKPDIRVYLADPGNSIN